MRVYVTGIAGFLGSHLADYLTAQGHVVLGADDYSSGTFENSVDYSVIRTDLGMGFVDELAEHMSGCEVVFHCAAAAYEGVSVFSPSFISNNIYSGSATTYSAAIKAGAKRIIFCSSMARYGRGTPPFCETDIPIPVDPYGVSKLAAERLLEALSIPHKIEYVIAIPHNIYGPRQNYWTPYRNVAAIMVNRMLQDKQPIIYGDGLQQRSFSYVHDIIPAMAKMIDCPNKSVINIGPGHDQRISILSLAHMISDLLGMEFKPIFMPDRPCEVKYATCTCERAEKLLGMEFKTPLRDGLKAMIVDIRKKGIKNFVYDLQIELPGSPKTWTERLI